MTFATFINILLMLLCVAVLVQSARMIRSFDAIKSGDLGETVKQLDNATAQARAVLAELKTILATDGAASVRTIQSGESLRDELSVMVGIGNAVAERIMDAAAVAGERSKESEAAAPAKAPRKRAVAAPAKPKRARTKPTPAEAAIVEAALAEAA
ncbi:hypothetical protein ACFB49_45300 [Sphingomonas sp. DBB INV C78]|uniref:DUF6468 domain-containing protein n=1 Tax=Sphingomonas sp. DBB INV C78 TaxID=3349434 RepID=UPI0036D331AF